MLIRTLNDGDIEQAIQLEADVYERVSGKPLRANDRFGHWFQTIDQELTVGIFDHDTLIGLAYATDQAPGPHVGSAYKRESLIIHPDYQGKGLGLGTKLFETMLAMVDCTTPHRASHSYIGEDNKPMQHLSIKFGAKPCGDNTTYEQDGRLYRAWARDPFAHIINDPVP